MDYQSQKRGQRKYLFAMTLVLLLAFALGANGLNRYIFWDVELSAIAIMGGFDPPYSPAQIIDSIAKYKPDHVPLYFFLGGLWGQIAGWSQVTMRLMSCFFGVLMAAWLYRFAADAVNRRTAVVAALLMSTSAIVMVYFHTLPSYTLFILLVVMHCWFYWRLAHHFRITRLTWVLFILTAGLLLYTHLLSVIVFAGLGAYHLLFAPRSRRWLNIMLGWGMGFLLFLPYVPFILGSFPHSPGYRHANTWNPINLIGGVAHLLVNGLDILWLPLMLSFAYALRRRPPPRAILGLLAIALTIAVIMLLASRRFWAISPARMRYFLIIWISMVILFAYGLTSMPRWQLVTALFLLLWGIAGVQLERSMDIHNYTTGRHYITAYPPLHDYADSLNNKTREGDYLIGFTKHWNVNQDRYNGWGYADYYLNLLLGIEGIFIWPEKRGGELKSDMKIYLDERSYALLAHDPSDAPDNYAETLEILQEAYIPCAVLVDKPDLLIQRYAHPAMGCDHESGG